MVAMVAMGVRSLSFLLEVQVADVSGAGKATAAGSPAHTPCTPWFGARARRGAAGPARFRAAPAFPSGFLKKCFHGRLGAREKAMIRRPCWYSDKP